MKSLKTFKPITHVIFDMDGVLLDTEVIYKSVIANIAKRYGKVYTPNIIAKVIGTPERESSRIAVTEMKLPMSVDDFQKEFNKSSHDQFHNLPLLPGAEKLINHLKYIRIPMAVATSSHWESYELKARPHKELFKAFSHVVCGGDDPEVKHGKPSPDIFLVCASRFRDKPKPEKCLVFEDSPNGVKAAVAAKMQAVMIPDELVPKELRKEATVVVKCLDETPLQAFGLPPIE
nr:unnamed protein product [Callosobruchus analis]